MLCFLPTHLHGVGIPVICRVSHQKDFKDLVGYVFTRISPVVGPTVFLVQR